MVKGVVINDSHFGVKESKRIYDELQQFKDFIEGSDDLNCVIINGDYFDCKLSIGDPASFYAVNFFSELIKIVRYKKLALRVLQGTRSHDLNQLQIFKHYEEDLTLDFQIIERAYEDELCGMKVLYLPEEYPEDCDEYYANFKDENK